VSTLDKGKPENIPCLAKDVIKFEQALALTLDRINNASTSDEFLKAVNTINVVQNYDGFVGCYSAIKSMTTTKPATVTIFGGRNCEIDPSTSFADWQADPCCNFQLQFHMCCAEKRQAVQINVLSAINYDIINATVPKDNYSNWVAPKEIFDDLTNTTFWFPSETGYNISASRQAVLDTVISILDQQVQAESIIQDSSDGCDAKLKNTIPPNYLSLAFNFFPKCQDIIFKKKTVTGVGNCAADSDCYTTCDLKTHKCTFPTTGANGNLDDAIVRCTIDNVRPEVLLYIRDMLNVPSLPAESGPMGLGFNARMAQALTNAVSNYDCDGPPEYSDGACLIDMPDEDCENSAFRLDPNNIWGNGLQLSKGLRWADDGQTSSLVSSQPEQHNGYNVQYQYVIIRSDIKDPQACLQLYPGNKYLEWVNITLNGGQGYDWWSNTLIPPTYTRSVCRIIMPELPDLNQPFDASSNSFCYDSSTPDEVTGHCSDGSMPGTMPTAPTDSGCFDGSDPDASGLCSNGQLPGWFPLFLCFGRTTTFELDSAMCRWHVCRR